MREKIKLEKKQRRIRRVRAKITGTSKRPRLSVFRSNKKIYAQIIDDEKGITITEASDAKLANNIKKVEKAAKVGQMLGEKLVKKGIKTIVFDRRGYKYHGRVKALADGVRSKGVNF